MSPPLDDDRVFFYIHIMKTAGGSFRNHMLATFGRDRCYPDWRIDEDEANQDLAALEAVDDERLERIRAYSGHFPYLATERLERRLGRPIIRLTTLRHPVDRTLSLLGDMRHWDSAGDRSVEELYDDPMINAMLIRDHMTKVFALTDDDDPPNYRHGLVIDDSRLELAQQRLGHVDLLGLQDRFDDFLNEVGRRFGWTIDDRPDRHRARGEPLTVSAAFCDRIAEDNPYDVAFYQYGVELVAARRSADSIQTTVPEEMPR